VKRSADTADALGAPRPRALVLHAGDNVAVAVAPLAAGEELELQGVRLTLQEPSSERRGHREFALYRTTVQPPAADAPSSR